jgi:hypothetical protein
VDGGEWWWWRRGLGSGRRVVAGPHPSLEGRGMRRLLVVGDGGNGGSGGWWWRRGELGSGEELFGVPKQRRAGSRRRRELFLKVSFYI